RAGERVTIADGSGRWRLYDVVSSDAGVLAVNAASPVHTEPNIRPTLAIAFGLTKGSKADVVVQQLTELGVDRILPVIAQRSVTRWDDARAAIATARFGRVAREAAAQSRRAHIPEVAAPAEVVTLAGQPGLMVADRLGAERGHDEPSGDEWLVLVGPEGGLAPEELEALGRPPVIGVGPHVLRAETAAVAVAAVLTARRGRPGPPVAGGRAPS
ncbi:MAG TPA: RsmE family RNA methyltransferase, partial [Acidimicrobiia bacterium]|nr:RsmE family RNA methyltransferase [Acidimicrobiia bacterium]